MVTDPQVGVVLPDEVVGAYESRRGRGLVVRSASGAWGALALGEAVAVGMEVPDDAVYLGALDLASQGVAELLFADGAWLYACRADDGGLLTAVPWGSGGDAHAGTLLSTGGLPEIAILTSHPGVEQLQILSLDGVVRHTAPLTTLGELFVAELDGQPGAEFVVSGGDVLSHTLQALPSPVFAPPVGVFDVDGDGIDEVLLDVGDAVEAVALDGTVVWRHDGRDRVLVADVTGDGRRDLVAHPGQGAGLLALLDPASGAATAMPGTWACASLVAVPDGSSSDVACNGDGVVLDPRTGAVVQRFVEPLLARVGAVDVTGNGQQDLILQGPTRVSLHHGRSGRLLYGPAATALFAVEVGPTGLLERLPGALRWVRLRRGVLEEVRRLSFAGDVVGVRSFADTRGESLVVDLDDGTVRVVDVGSGQSRTFPDDTVFGDLDGDGDVDAASMVGATLTVAPVWGTTSQVLTMSSVFRPVAIVDNWVVLRASGDFALVEQPVPGGPLVIGNQHSVAFGWVQRQLGWDGRRVWLSTTQDTWSYNPLTQAATVYPGVRADSLPVVMDGRVWMLDDGLLGVWNR